MLWVSVTLLLVLPSARAQNLTDASGGCIFAGEHLFNNKGHYVACDALAGRAVAIYFAGEWCPLCRKESPHRSNSHQPILHQQPSLRTSAQHLAKYFDCSPRGGHHSSPLH
jgi:thiol-disulfide isomerase/thioredoxin